MLSRVARERTATFGAVLFAWATGMALLFLTQVDYDYMRVAVGPDSYLRLLRVQSLWETGGWYDQFVERINAPFGYQMHWTRPLDVLLLLGALPLVPFVGFDRALWQSGLGLAPGLYLLCYFAFLWAVRPLIQGRIMGVAVVVFFFQFGILSDAMPARIDQELLLLLCTLVFLGMLVRVLLDAGAVRGTAIAGMASGLGIWLSVELLVVLVIGASVLGLVWAREGARRRAQNLAFSVGALGVVVAALLFERPPSRWLMVEYDKVSIVHATLVLLLVVFWVGAGLIEERRAVRTWTIRTIMGAAGAVILGAILTLVFPMLLADPMSTGSADLERLWFSKIEELQGLGPWDPGGPGRFLIYLGSSLIALPTTLVLLWKRWRDVEWGVWLALALFTLFFFAMSTRYYRFALYAQAVAALSLTVVLYRWIHPAGARGGLVRAGVRAVASLLVLLGPFVVGVALSAQSRLGSPPPPSDARCDVAPLIPELQDFRRTPAGTPLTILANIGFGAEIAFRSRHAVIADSSHRNPQGFLDTYRFFSSVDDAEARDVALARSVDAVLVCLNRSERKFFIREDGQASLFDRLREGDSPEWLEPVTLPEDLGRMFRLYRVVE